uniref:Uncharacterized protein n=1 Tax=Tetranychus urticae TaxID=32264 RepID=T1L4Z4_TETUR
MGCVLSRNSINPNLVAHQIINGTGFDEWPTYSFEGFTRSCYCGKACSHGFNGVNSGCQTVRTKRTINKTNIGAIKRRHSFGHPARAIFALFND